MSDKWLVARDGVTGSPRTWEQVVVAAKVGDIVADDLVWTEGDSTSRPAGKVPGLVPEIVAVSEAWLVRGRGDPQHPAKRIFNRHGRLVLHSDRLLFVAVGDDILLDLPLAEVHSVSPAETGTALEVWHGETRHRFLIPGSAQMVVTGPMPDGLIGTVMYAEQAAAAMRIVRLSRIIVQEWVALLTPMVAPQPPAGVQVRPPRRGLAYAAVFGFKLVLLLVGVVVICVVPMLLLAG